MDGRSGEKKQNRIFARTLVLFIAAWACTLAGDYFLSITQTHLTMGIALFCIVQTMYMLHLNPTRTGLILRAAIFGILCGILLLIRMFSLQNVLAVLDITMLGMNAFCAWKQRKSGKLLFAIGLTLFFCCDVCVGLRSVLPVYMSTLMLVLIWTFYLPSQILIVIYGIKTLGIEHG